MVKTPNDLKTKLELQQYRLGLLLVLLIFLPYGFISEYLLGFSYDTFLIRLPIGLISFVFLLLSFRVTWISKNLRFIFLILASALTYQYFGFFKQSNEHFYYTIGIAITPVIVAALLYHNIDLIIYYAFFIFVISQVLEGMTAIYFITYLTMSATILIVYGVVTRNRNILSNELNLKIAQLVEKQNQIDEKNKSLIKIGELATQVAHDIRSPVTALEAVTQMIGEEIDPRKKRLIENAAKRINAIANNLVAEYREKLTQDLSHVEINRMIDLNSLIEDIVEEKRLSLDSKHQVTVAAPESISVPNNVNPIEFQRVISNLINNSIEAMDKSSGLISVELRREGARVKITVRDNGKGISSDQITKIFNKGVSGKAQGAGLGLAHAKQFIESAGGSISVESVPMQETTISILL